MNREIKFRGFDRNNKKWVYGDLIHTPERTYRIIWFELKGELPLDVDYNSFNVLVESQSIGQYTGLKDKNGVEIYEGDILKGETTNHFASNRINNYKVIWGRDSWHIGKTYMSLQELFNFCDVGIEVIGNIYENSELLK